MSDIINHRERLWGIAAPWEDGQGQEARRKATSMLAYLLLLFDDRPHRIWDLLDSRSKDVVTGALEGLLRAARSGRDIERFLGRMRKWREQELPARILREAKEAPASPPERSEWTKGENHCEVRQDEVA